MHLRALQKNVVETGKIVFGEANVTDPRERLLRFTEEAFELIRAAGLSYSDACNLLAYEYFNRKPGSVPQEIAGTASTLLALAEARGIDTEEVLLAEMARILEKREECRAKHDAKPAWATAMKATAA